MLEDYQSLQSRINACAVCAEHLPNAPKPILQINPSASILIAGQAPGAKAHDSGIPFNDASGIRLRQWLGVSENTFYDASKIAILPIAFCYPGKGPSGDLPPRNECVNEWRESVMALLPNIALTIIIGKFAYAHYYPTSQLTLTEAVKSGRDGLSNKIILPHPSPRNNIWIKRNPWFEQDIVLALQASVNQLITR